MLQYRNISKKVESQLFKRLTTEPIKGEDKYIHRKLKVWRERINANFHGQDVPYDKYCNPTAVFEIDSVYKQSKNYHLQGYIEEYKYTNAESR